MRGITSGAADVWVLLSEAELADPNHLMIDWLDDEAELISLMAENPKIIERPIVVSGRKAAIGRPPENVLEIL